MNLDVLTANITGDAGNVTVEKERNILDYFFHENQPDLILIQESLWKTDNITANLTSMSGNYEMMVSKDDPPGKRETILWRVTNSPKLTPKSFYSKDLNYLVLGRAKVVTFTANRRSPGTNEPDLIVISWHGPNKRPDRINSDDEYKKEIFKELLQLVQHLNNNQYNHRVPVILGGDFNIDYKDVQDLIGEYGLQSLEYPKPQTRLSSRHRQVDFFIVTSDVTLDEVYAIPYEMDPDGETMNHVPVLARLTFPFILTKVRT